jgi:hypothetical protein
MREHTFQPHCCRCGKFVSWGADYRMLFVYGWASEPPDPEYYCKGCAELRKSEIKTFEDLPNWYKQPDFVLEKAEEFGAVYDWKYYRWKRKDDTADQLNGRSVRNDNR